MSEQKFLPRLFVVERHASFQSNFTPILEIIAHHKPWKSAYGETKEYLSLAEHQHLMAEKDKRIERLREALEFYSRNGGASDTHDRKGCWILARRFCFVEAIAHDCEKLPYGETGTEYYMAGKLARAALQEDGE